MTNNKHSPTWMHDCVVVLDGVCDWAVYAGGHFVRAYRHHDAAAEAADILTVALALEALAK